MVVTELVLPAGHAVRPVDLGAVAGCGHDRLRVRRRPSVGIIPTGSELVPIGRTPASGEILEYNSLVLAAQVESWGGQARRYPIVADDLDRIRETVLQAAASHDLLLVNAGSSAGLEDFTARVIEQVGEVLAHGVAVRPGHPVILGLIKPVAGDRAGKSTATPVIGVPGFPVSAALTGEIFVEPLLAHWLGRPGREPERLQAALTRKVHSSHGDDEYLRVTVGRVGDRWVAAPLPRGAGVITSLVRADGLVLIPAGIQGVEAGETVEVRLYRSTSELERTIVALGSHDLSLDLLAQELAQRGARLTSANLGSQGGLIAAGVVLTVVLLLGSAIDFPISGGVGERKESPSTLARLQEEYRLGVGQLTIDLTAIEVVHAIVPVRVKARVGIGELVVVVRSDLPVRVEARAALGNVRIFDVEGSGIDVERDVGPRPSDEAVLILELSVGIGQVEVRRG